MRVIRKGATSQTVYVIILDSTSTTGGRKTGLAYNTASLTAYYARNGEAATAITLATLAAANSAWSSGGFKEVDATNMPGLYRLDLPDAAVDTGADSVVVTLKGATGMVQVDLEVQLVAWNPQDTLRGGLTALPQAAAQAAGGLFTRGTGAGQINQAANGQIDVNLATWLSSAPNALQSGRVDSYVGAVAAGIIAAASFAANALDAVWSTATRTLTSGANIALAKGTGVTGFNDLSAAQVNAEVDTALADYDGPTHAELVAEIDAVQVDIDALPTNAELATALASADDATLAAIAGLSIPSAATIADAVHDEAIVGTHKFRELMRGISSALLGKASGLDAFAPVYRDVDDSKDVITATTDIDGNRTAVTLDLS